jgi:hypothetical protein
MCYNIAGDGINESDWRKKVTAQVCHSEERSDEESRFAKLETG